jgi:hypothetical protein
MEAISNQGEEMDYIEQHKNCKWVLKQVHGIASMTVTDPLPFDEAKEYMDLSNSGIHCVPVYNDEGGNTLEDQGVYHICDLDDQYIKVGDMEAHHYSEDLYLWVPVEG